MAKSHKSGFSAILCGSAALALGACVVAAEPNPLLMKVLDRWYGSNSTVKLVQKAVGQESRPGGYGLDYLALDRPQI